MRAHLLTIIALSLCGTLSVPTTSDAQATKKVWTIAEILEERSDEVTKNKAPACNNPGAPATTTIPKCVCPNEVTTLVQYRPSIQQCGKNAGIIVSGRYIKMFSAVVRDKQDRDRWPAKGVNGCSRSQVAAGLGKCSVFKVQKIIAVDNAGGDAEVHCLGASGYSTLFRDVARITIKPPREAASTQVHPEAVKLERLCLNGPDLALN
jgi:hypothetical protein